MRVLLVKDDPALAAAAAYLRRAGFAVDVVGDGRLTQSVVGEAVAEAAPALVDNAIRYTPPGGTVARASFAAAHG